MRILLADSHPIVRSGLEAHLSELFPGHELTQVDNGSSALRCLTAKTWDLLITEISLENRDGLEIIRRVRQENKTLPILVFTGQDIDAYCVPTMRAGAHGILHKSSPADKLRLALCTVAAGRRFIDEAATECLAQGCFGQDCADPHLKLSDREREIFLQLAQGHSVNRIATAFCLAPKTIYAHRANIFKKMSLDSDMDLARYAFTRRMIPCRRFSHLAMPALPAALYLLEPLCTELLPIASLI
ncbi:response regulator [Haliea sp. E17]|uniref:response regulator n=1 Tax=Haliea sp. E17 TaxID=3401576 RepID=UPI003AB0BBE1